MDALWQDVRYGVRNLRGSPGFTAVAVATLAIGIGVNSAIFTVIEAVLLRPLPVSDPDALVMIWENNVVRGRDRNVVNPANFLAWRERNGVFAEMAGFSRWDTSLTGLGDPERLEIEAVTGNFFHTLGVGAALGRVLTEEDGRPGAPDVALLSHATWRRRFAGDPKVVGRTITLNDHPATVVGVLPAVFDLMPNAELYLPFTIDEGWRSSRGRWLMSVARLKPGVSVAQAQAEMSRLAANLARERPDFNSGWSATVAPLHGDLVREVRPALLALAGAVAFVLLIAWANVANLMLARAVARERELAIRASLGASAGRLVRQLLTESLVLAAGGAAAGLTLGAWGLDGLLAIVPPTLSTAGIRLDGAAVAFTLALSAASVLAFGLVPAWHVARPALARSLKEGGRVAAAAASDAGSATRSSCRRSRSPSSFSWGRACS